MDTAEIQDHEAGLASGPTPSTDAPARVVSGGKKAKNAAAPPVISASEPADPKAEAADRIILEFTDSLRNSPISRMQDAWNHLTTVSCPALRAAILKEL